MDLTFLLPLLSNAFSWHPSRIKTFGHIIIGMIAAGAVQQHKVAVGFEALHKLSSTCQRIRRFFKEQEIDGGIMARVLMDIVGLTGPVHLVLDRTNWQFGRVNINMLVLAVVVHRRLAIPLLVKALPKKGNSNGAERIELFTLFLKTFPYHRIASFMADREFIGKEWIDFLTAHKIPFFIRIKANRLVDYGGKQTPIAPFFAHLKRGQKRYLHKTLGGYSCFIAATKSQEGELVIIMSNQDQGLKILDIYRKRWTIEILFRHTKENGFNLEDTHLVHPDRIEKLFLTMAVALTLAFRFGQKEERRHKTPFRKTVAAPLFSTFRRGFDALKRLLFHKLQHALRDIAQILQPLTKKL